MDTQPKLSTAEKWNKLGKSLQGLGCLLILIVTIPLCIIMVVLL